MNERISAAAVIWNEEPDRLVFLLEELCVEMKESRLADPVIVNCRRGDAPPRFHLTECHEGNIRGLKGMARGQVPFLEPAQVGILKKGDKQLSSFLYLLLADETVLESLYQGVDDILFIARPGSDAISQLFKAINLYKFHPARYPRFHILYSGEDKLEAAAGEFVALRDEVKTLCRNQVDITFAGSCAINYEKIDVVRSLRMPYRELFRGDPFCGQLLYCSRNFTQKVDKVEFDGAPERFFERFAANVT